MIGFETAQTLQTLGFCVLPAHATQKKPTIPWKEFQHRCPSEEELEAMFPAPRCCVVCGSVSGNLEILDFDSQGVAFEPWLKKLPRKMIRRLFVEQTPSGGIHVVYRCTERVEKNLKLANGADGKVIIETRGEGGLFLCYPSAGYVCTQGTWDTIPILTSEERRQLLDAARSLDTPKTVSPPPAPSVPDPVSDNSELSPAEDFNARADVRPILTAHGWRYFRRTGENEEWTRPGISGPSGCGKDWGRYYLKELFTLLGLPESIRESYQSFPAIQNDLRYQYSPKLILWDEFGKAIQMMNLRTAAPHTKEIIPGLMKLYTSAHTWFTPSIKADIGSRKEKPDYSPIRNPFVTLLGTATPDQLLGNLSMEMVSEGFLGRAFLFEAVDDPTWIPTIRHQALQISDDVLVEAIRQQSSPAVEWDPDQKRSDASQPPEARQVGLVGSAEKILNDLLARQTRWVQDTEDGVLWARAEEQAEKLALLYAVSADPETPLIDEKAALWGVRMAEHLTLKRIRLAQTWVSASDFDAKQKEVLRYVRSQGGTIARDKLRRRFWKWTAKERNEIFDNLLETGKLKSWKEKTGKREKCILSTRSKPTTKPTI